MYIVFQHSSHLKTIKFILTLMLCFLALKAQAVPQDLAGSWYAVPAVKSVPATFLKQPFSEYKDQLTPDVEVRQTGGHFVFLSIESAQA